MKFLNSYKHPLSILLTVASVGLCGLLFEPKTGLFLRSLILVAYFLCLSYWWRIILHKHFGFDPRQWVSAVYAFASAFFLFGFVLSIWITWYQLSDNIMWWSMLFVAFATYAILYFSTKGSAPALKPRSTFAPQFSSNVFLIIIPLLLALFALIAYKQGPSADLIFSPWQAYKSSIFYIIFLLLLSSGALVFSRHKTSMVLGVILLVGFVIRLALPLSHELPWGGDVWRLIASESRLADREAIPPVIAGPQLKTREVFGLPISEALLIPHKYTYGHLWGTTIAASSLLDLPLLSVNIWLLPILWSIFVPVFLYHIGVVLFKHRRSALMFVWLSLLPFTLFAVSSLTLPVSLGTIFFLFYLSLFLQLLEQQKKKQLILVLLFAILSIFGYTLYTIIIWLLLLCAGIFLLAEKYGKHPALKKNKWTKYVGRSLMVAFVCAAILGVEHFILGGLTFSGVEGLKQIGGALSGWFLSSEIRSHDIVFGNIFFNHVPEKAFVSSLFTTFRFHLMVIVILLWLLAAYGWFFVFIKKHALRLKVFITLSGGLIAAYILGWGLFDGHHLLVRRLDPLIAICVLALSIFGVLALRTHWKKYRLPATALLTALLLSWFGATALALGPDSRTMTTSHYNLAQIVSAEFDHHPIHPCVIADTWTLLAVEGLTQGRIIAGGFPIDEHFGQAEAVAAYEGVQMEPETWLTKVQESLRAESCHIITEQNAKIEEFLGEPTQQIGNISLWKSGWTFEGK